MFCVCAVAEATECDVSEDGTTAVCNGVVVDLAVGDVPTWMYIH